MAQNEERKKESEDSKTKTDAKDSNKLVKELQQLGADINARDEKATTLCKKMIEKATKANGGM